MYRMMRSVLTVGKKKARILVKLTYNSIRMRLRFGFIDSIERWIDKENSKSLPFDCHPVAWYKTFSKEIELFKLDKRVLHRNEFRLFNEIRWSLFKELKIFYVSNAFVLGQDAIVMSPDRRIFQQLTYPSSARIWRYDDFFGRTFFPAATTKFGWYTSLTCPTSYNFFHWMMECLPRLAVLESYVNLLDGIVVPANPSPFHYESLRALGISDDRLMKASPQLHLKLEHFFASNYSARDNPPPWLHIWYKEKFIQPLRLEPTVGRKIYVSRDDASIRKLSNSEEIHAMVSRLGFEVVSLSKLSFIEQATLFYSSDVIIGEHGAGLTNLLFCREGTKVIEIFSVFWIAPCFYAIAVSAGLEYHFHLAEPDAICSLAGKESASKHISNTLDAQRSRTYTVDADDLRRKVLEVIASSDCCQR
jgi:capsular polysaccharide biosynthesis protein